MAADVEVSTFIPAMVSTGRLEGILVAPDKTKEVPNHLTETRIFGKAKANRTLQVFPSTVLFEGYKVGRNHQCTLRILNRSTLNQPMHIIPPKTSVFSIKYSKKRSSLIPGLSINVVIEFKPTDWQYYYDCIRIHCQGEQNILVPIHAYPVVNTASFPQYVVFEPTPIGRSRTKTVHLKSDVPVEFEYKLSYLQSNPAYSIEKMQGVVPANGEVGIDVIFSPTEFCTAIMELKLEISQYNFTFKSCTFSGTSAPGLALKQLKLPSGPLPPTTQPKAAKLPGVASRNSKKSKVLIKVDSGLTIPGKVDQGIYKEGILVPANLDTPSAVAKILLQEPGKMKASEVRKVMSQTSAMSAKESALSAGIGSRQVKQAAFLQAVEAVANEERANHLRWVTQLGELPTTDEQRDMICQAQQTAMEIYQNQCNPTVPEEEYSRTTPIMRYHRIRRRPNELAALQHSPPTFDLYSNNLFTRRHMALRRFEQAARKVLVRLRCQRRLEKLQQVVRGLKAGKSIRASLADIYDTRSPVASIVPLLPSSSEHISPLSFPKCTGHSGGGAEERVRDTPVQAKAFSVSDFKKETPFLDLKVPQQSELLGYSHVQFPSMGSHIPPGMPREMWSGAEDEFDSLSHIPGVDPTFLTAHAFTESALKLEPSQDSVLTRQPEVSPPKSIASSSTVHSESLEIMPHITSAPITKTKLSVLKPKVRSTSTMLEVSEPLEMVMDGADEDSKTVATAVVMPPSLLESPHNDPMRILNPSPNVSSYLPLLPHSEATLDHALLPLPPYPTAKHPLIKPDPMEVLPVLMKWRQFPSPWLNCSDSDKKLASVWKPCLSDQCTTDLLPSLAELPPMLSGVQTDDYVDTQCSEVLPVPSMKMVKTQFLIPCSEESAEVSTAGTENKEELHPVKPQSSKLFHHAQEELEKYRTHQFNQLGQQISSKLHSFLKQLDGSTDDN